MTAGLPDDITTSYLTAVIDGLGALTPALTQPSSRTWQNSDMGETVRVSGLDHIVLVCSDVERTLAWYRDLLGLTPERVDEWRRGEVPFPSVRVDVGTIIDLIGGEPTDGRLDHFCLVVDPIDLDAIAASGEFTVIDGPARRFGARGDGTSLYVRDPDGAVVELRHY